MPYETHKGLLKIGEATLTTTAKPESLVPNCHELNQAAMARIKGYTATASVSFTLLHTELAIKTEDGYPFTFKDKDVHRVLMNSGIHKVQPNGATGEEWFATTLDIAKNAIKAVKESRTSLSANESQGLGTSIDKIEFREEQLDAIDRTIKSFKKHNEMLWYAKMRFGKTLTALEVVRRSQYRKVIIVTHRPVVSDGWGTDFKKIFYPGSSEHDYSFECKTTDSAYIFDEKTDSENDLKIRNLDASKKHFIYFASIQDLRGSQLVGGKFNKNNAVFALNWDLVIVDEAHEGTQTSLGDAVVKKLRKEGTKVLMLSGTPFNLLSQYNDENTYTWDYVMEQKRKDEWDFVHHGDHNPYADLPKMHIYTYDLGEKLKQFVTDEYGTKAFNFREFFRVWSKGPNGKRELPKDAIQGKFVHEKDVMSFLNLLVTEDSESGYPFANEEYRDMFRHTLWMVPGVKEARALSELLRSHPVFGNGNFGIANVAGEGDYYEEEHSADALELVRNTIKSNKYSITLSCGKLTTGVTVKEWTAVLMLSGSYSTAAAQYMQTIFRVQSAGSIDGRQKTDCYVFDFAPDRTLKVLAETVHLSRKPGKNQEKRREAMKEFLNYCPVIAIAGSKMTSYSVNTMMEQIKQIYAERAVNSGFEDESIYNDELLKLDELDASMFNNLNAIIGKTKASKKKDSVVVNGKGLTDEQIATIDDGNEDMPAKIETLTPAEKAEREKKKQAKEARKKAIDILRGISIRMPLMIYGADVPLDEDIDVEHFIELVDDNSWEEFMPRGVTKEMFMKFTKYYDRDVFIAAGKRIRRLAAAADKETPTERVKQIAEIFRHFKNPDKETVLTPWRVVNLHMSDTIGGWCFFNEQFEEDTNEGKHRLDEPRFVDRGEVTHDIFRENGKVLEINSKTGLYPLYVAYSFYRQKLEDTVDEDWEPEELTEFWNEVIRDNVYVICKTKMAKAITNRTLRGFSNASVNTHYFEDLVNMLKNKPDQFKKKVLQGSYWKKEVSTMKFDAVVGNPPYQVMDGGGKGYSAIPIYNLFVESAKQINPEYISMITPSRWFAGGKGLDEFRSNMLADKRIAKIVDFIDNEMIFKGVGIAGGVNYFLWDSNYYGDCEFTSVRGDTKTTMTRSLQEYDILVRNNAAVRLIRRLEQSPEKKMDKVVYARNVFGLASGVRGLSKPDSNHRIKLYSSEKSNCMTTTYISEDDVAKETDLINKYKVIMGKVVPRGGEVGIDPSIGYRAITTIQVLYPNSVFTDSYLLLAVFDTENEAINFAKYMTLRFPRFLLHETYSSMNISKGNFRFVPFLDYSFEWTDTQLFEKYECDEEEINMIVSVMRPLEYVLQKENGAEKCSIYDESMRSYLAMSYESFVSSLIKKYGKVNHNYFIDTACTIKNKLVSRTSEGLYCHHIDEDKAIMLSNDKFAAANPFEYQKANRLVYCNLLEHLLLHVKIAEEPRNADANERELPGIGGAVNFLCKELNDIYAGKEFEEEWRQKIADAVKDHFDDYIAILKHLWKIVEHNPVYKLFITKDSLCVGYDGKVVNKVMQALVGEDK